MNKNIFCFTIIVIIIILIDLVFNSESSKILTVDILIKRLFSLQEKKKRININKTIYIIIFLFLEKTPFNQ